MTVRARLLYFGLGLILGGAAWPLGLALRGAATPAVTDIEVHEEVVSESPAGEDEVALQRFRDQLVAVMGTRHRSDLKPLYVFLDDAVFSNNWGKVEMVAAVVRDLGRAWLTADPVPVEPGQSLAQSVHEIQRRLEVARLAMRRNEATALAQRGDRQAIGVLTDLLHTSGELQVRSDAAQLLARCGDQRAIDVLTEGLQATSEDVRKAAGAALADQEYLAGALAMGELLAHDPRVEVRLSSVENLARFAAVVVGDEDHPAVASLLTVAELDSQPAVRAAILQAFASADLNVADRVVDVVFERLRRDSSAEVRLAAATTLAEATDRFGMPPQVPSDLVAVLRLERDPQVAVAILGLLGSGDADVLSALDALAMSGYRVVPSGKLDGVRELLRRHVKR